MLLLAHRGDWRRWPENSLAALLAGAALEGVDGVEFDVRSSADGKAVIIHDADLRRVQGIDAAVAQLTASELAGHGLTSLSELLEALPARSFLDIEIKEPVGPAFVAACRGGRGAVLEQAVVSSFDPQALGELADLQPAWPRWLNSPELTDKTVAVALELGCAAVSVAQEALDPATMERATSAGLAVAAWTARTPTEVERLRDLGVIAVSVEDGALPPERPAAS